MNRQHYLENIVNMMGSIKSINPVSEMTSVIRRSVLLYYVQPKHLSKSRLRKIYDLLDKKLSKSVKRKSDKQVFNYLSGRVYAKQIVLPGDKIEFEFYVTKDKYDGIDVVRGVNAKNNTDPDFLRPGNAYKIDEEIISLSDKVPGDSVRMLKTSRRYDQLEMEFLEQFQNALKMQGLGRRTTTVVIGDKTLKNVGGIVKKSGQANAPGADFVFIDVDGNDIKGTGISHKAEIFRSYGGIKKLSSELEQAVELKEFIQDAREAWKKAIKLGQSPREVGFVRDLNEDAIRRVLYKGDIDYVVIGNLKFDYDEKSNSIIVHGPGLYQSPQIPKKEYQPVLKSIYGTGGSKIKFGLAADLYFDLSDMNDMDPSLVSDALGRKISSMQMEPEFVSLEDEGIPEIKKIIVAAKLPVRLECVPRLKASSKRLKKI